MSDDHMNWRAVQASEVFSNYLQQEWNRQPEMPKEASISEAIGDLEQFQNYVRHNPKLLSNFQHLQANLQNPAFRSQFDPKIASTIMLLDLSTQIRGDSSQ